MMLGEVIGHVCDTFSPDEFELVLLNSVFYPLKIHVKRFGDFLTHGRCKDSLGG